MLQFPVWIIPIFVLIVVSPILAGVAAKFVGRRFFDYDDVTDGDDYSDL